MFITFSITILLKFTEIWESEYCSYCLFLKRSLIEDCFILSNLLWFILFETFRSKESRFKSVMKLWVRREPASYFVLYFQSHFMMLPFFGRFYRVSHQQSDSNKFKDFKTFEYYDIRIETFKLTTVEHQRMKKLDSDTKIRITWWKIRPGDPNICSI